jgi:hypothetical protein
MPDIARQWCLFTSAGDRNAIRQWLDGGAPRRWDLVVAYYGDSENEYAEISILAFHAFRQKGSKFQNLKSFDAANPHFFDQYSHVWVCDDDIQMCAEDIDEAFAIAERLGFWIAQPAFRPEGKNSHPITVYAGGDYLYRLVNFVEVGVPIFLRSKLAEFLNVYDGSLTSYGIDYWYLNVFDAHRLGILRDFSRPERLNRFAIIDKVRVLNPTDEMKGGREMDRLKPLSLCRSDWQKAMTQHGLVEFRHKVFASVKPRAGDGGVTLYDVLRQMFVGAGSRVRRKLGRAKRIAARAVLKAKPK